MNVLVKTLSFSILLILIFTGVTHMLPQMKGEAPAVTEFDVAELTMESFVAMGESIYEGAGTCSLCHNELGRAPDLFAFDITAASLQRLEDPRYQGDATDAESYLRESMLQPSIYVVEGFGSKGSNDTESPMPAIDKPPVQLSALAIDAIIAYLQTKDGNPVTVSLPAAIAETPDVVENSAPVAAQSPEEALAKYGCASCHAVLASEATLGPNLRDIAGRQNAGEIRRSIVDPGAVVDDGYFIVMPKFPNMTLGELQMIVEFLATQEGEST